MLSYLDSDQILISEDFKTPSSNLSKQNTIPTGRFQKCQATAIIISGLTGHMGGAMRWKWDGNPINLDCLLKDDQLIDEDVHVQPQKKAVTAAEQFLT